MESKVVPFAIPSVLLFSVLVAQENERIIELSKVINSIIVLRDTNNLELLSKATSIFSNEIYALKVQSFIDGTDLGFKTIFDKIKKRLTDSSKFSEQFLKNVFYERDTLKFELFTYHKIYDEFYKEKKVVEFQFLKKESEGSIKFFIIVSILVYAIKNNLLLIIDELDSKFHSDLLNLIIKKFHDPAINNTEAQLIFMSHNTVLLDKKLGSDQVVFVEKNEFGESFLRRRAITKINQ